MTDPMEFEFGQYRRMLLVGATGFLGSELLTALARDTQCKVAVLSRDPERARAQFNRRGIALDAAFTLADLPKHSAQDFDAIVHLAGANILALPWTRSRKRTLEQSRIGIAQALQGWLAASKARPALYIQASAVGIYPTQSASALDEQSPAGQGYAAELCSAIEAQIQEIAALGIRSVALRIGVVLGRNALVFRGMKLGTQLGGGATLGHGEQYFPWVHVDDVIGAIAHCMRTRTVTGPINVVAPEATSNARYTAALAKALRRPNWLRVPAWILRAALGERSALLLEGAAIVPNQLQRSGYVFCHPKLDPALSNLIGN
jgi:uncharacterized protein